MQADNEAGLKKKRLDTIQILEYTNIMRDFKEYKMEKYAEIFKALAHPIRLRIVCGLSKKDECNVSKMVEALGVAQPTVSQHLNILKNAGIITGYKNGTQICYKVTNDEARKIVDSMETDICE